MKFLKKSKDLICKVLNIPLDSTIDVYIDGNYLLIRKINNRIKEHNIYEFAFKCKEWASSNNYSILSGVSDEQAYRNDNEKAYAKVVWYVGDDIHRIYKGTYLFADTEVEAIINASNYILSILSNKGLK